jgi:ankyrin repeat protein
MATMDVHPKSKAPNNSPQISVPFRIWGWLAFVGAFPFVLRFAYEQTVMTWDVGLQMVGWTLIHTHGGLFVLGIFAVIFLHIWLLVFVALWARRLIRKERVPFGTWTQFAILGWAIVLLYIPYGFWQFVTVEFAGPGHRAASQLTAAAAQNQKYLVKAFLRSGVAIDVHGEDGRTALGQACLAGQVEMAHYLASKGAQLDEASDCRTVPEFAAIMKPLAPAIGEPSGRLHLPGTSIEVTAPAPQGDYSRTKSKP